MINNHFRIAWRNILRNRVHSTIVMAMFTTQRRVKEIGIRKVLGASVSSILTLLAKDFVKLTLLALVVACPVAWWAMDRWLTDFAYRIDIQCGCLPWPV
ncbi:ABC transporter permease [Parapedobacter deserti]|uniref:ABC transporter permease n=1 Tax=Parapedobacter deserti TaxID=1912957 RepID=A0ABV7JIG9_9SPHI